MAAAQQKSQGPSEDTKTIVTVLLLIFIYPVGVIVMWFWPKWAMWAKILLTAFSIVPLIFALYFWQTFMGVFFGI